MCTFVSSSCFGSFILKQCLIASLSKKKKNIYIYIYYIYKKAYLKRQTSIFSDIHAGSIFSYTAINILES